MNFVESELVPPLGEQVQPTPSADVLSLEDQICERALLFMLDRPNHKIQHPNLLPHIRKELAMAPAEWGIVSRRLIKDIGVLSLGLGANGPHSLTLELETIDELDGEPFYTAKVADKAREVQQRKTMSPVQKQSKQVVAQEPVARSTRAHSPAVQQAGVAKKRKISSSKNERQPNRRFGYRMFSAMEIIDEAGGTMPENITAKDFRDYSGDIIGVDSYTKALDRLEELGYITPTPRSLTEKGAKKLEELRANPEHVMPKKENLTLKKSTFRIVEFVSDQAAYEELVKGEDGTVIEVKKWLYPLDSTRSMYADLSNCLDMNIEATARRVTEIASSFKYIELKKYKADDGPGKEFVVNISVTKEGAIALQKYIELTEQNLAISLASEKKAIQLDELTTTCVELAENLGSSGIIKELRARRDVKHPMEMTEIELKQEMAEVSELLDNLRQTYALKFGKATLRLAA